MYHETVCVDNPRKNALDAMKNSVSCEQWERNSEFTTRLRQKIKSHPISSHPVLELLYKGRFSRDSIKTIHLDYRHSIVQIFTDALLMAQVQTKQLEPRLPSGSKMFPRFLLTLNILDEFGFEAGHDVDGYYRGNPKLAHYPLFEGVLNDLGVTEGDRKNYSPSSEANALNNHLCNSFSDYASIVALLAAAEEQVIIFSPALRAATAAIGVNVDSGYYFVHGTGEHENTNANDDDHEDDLWAALNQACTNEMYTSLEATVMTYLDMWCDFWTRQEKLTHQPIFYADSEKCVVA
jgi:hypothetical protein